MSIKLNKMKNQELVLKNYPSAKGYELEGKTLYLNFGKRSMIGAVMAKISHNPVDAVELFLLGSTITEVEGITVSDLDMSIDSNFYALMSVIIEDIGKLLEGKKI